MNVYSTFFRFLGKLVYVCLARSCRYSSKHLGNMLKHIQGVHEKIRKHACDQCTYTSTRPTGLRRPRGVLTPVPSALSALSAAKHSRIADVSACTRPRFTNEMMVFFFDLQSIFRDFISRPPANLDTSSQVFM